MLMLVFLLSGELMCSVCIWFFSLCSSLFVIDFWMKSFELV